MHAAFARDERDVAAVRRQSRRVFDADESVRWPTVTFAGSEPREVRKDNAANTAAAASRARRREPEGVPAARAARRAAGRCCVALRFVAARVADVAQPAAQILLEAAPQQLANARRCRGRQQTPVRLALEDRGERVGDRLAARTAAGPVSISNSTQPNAQMSARLSTRLPARLLGAHVGRGAEDRCPRASTRAP